jgi:pimeloyl-ACP methyl ester carboxylesterase
MKSASKTAFIRLALVLALPIALTAQLVPTGQPVPTGPNPPVVFLNGYQIDCSSSSFHGTFGAADTVLQASQIVTLFFDNCSVPNSPTLETLGAAFGQYLAALKYTDGTPVTQVDVVAHSMGGLIVRTYLSGKQTRGTTVFQPPASPGIRKIIFLGTPHFGTSVASSFGVSDQASEMSTGSQFLFTLNTWNDGTDDLRGLDVLSVAGNGGTGAESSIAGFDDGVVTLTSASISYARPGRTRVITACHTDTSFLSALGYCKSGVPLLANVVDASGLNAQIITSFLTGTKAWQSLGTAIEDNMLAANLGGINIEAQDLNGVPQTISSASIVVPQGTLNLLLNGVVAFSEGLTPNMSLVGTVKVDGAPTLSPTVTVPAGTVIPVIAKPGPVINRIQPAAGVTSPLNAAPGQFLTIYGSNLSATTLSTPTVTYPTQLADVQVLVNGVAAPIEYISPTQINFVNVGKSRSPTQTGSTRPTS